MLGPKWLYVSSVIALLGALVHLGALWNEPVFDDTYVVAENPNTEEPFNLAAHLGAGFWGPNRPEVVTWRPLTTLTLSWNRVVHGLNPLGYRLVNLVLHGVATFLVILLALQFDLGLAAAALVGIVFAVHPVHVEAVITYAGRAELLMTIFALLGFWFYERERYISSAACLGLSLLSKEMAIVAALLIVWRHWTAKISEKNASDKSHWWWTAPVVVTLFWLGARYAALGHLAGASPGFIDNPLAHVGYAERILPSLSLYLHAVELFFAPFSLAADLSYAAFDPNNIPLSSAILGGVLLIATLGATLYFARTNSILSCCLALWTGGYLLVSHLGPTMPMVFGERTLYLPSAGLLLAVGFAFKRLLAHPRLRTGTAVVTLIVAALFTLRSAVRVGDWRDPKTFYQALLRDAPNNLKALTNLANLEFAEGNAEGAVAYAEQAVAVGESTWLAQLTAAQLYIGLHNGQKAAEHLVVAERLSPGRASIISARCALSARFLQPHALSACLRATQNGSDLLGDTIHLAIAYSNAQNHVEAEKTFQQAATLEGNRGIQALHGYAIYLARRGDLPQARALLLKALTQQPRSQLLLDTLQKVDQGLSAGNKTN